MNNRNKYRGKYSKLGTPAQITPLQVKVRGDTKEDFESAFRAFKKLVQDSKIISLYKEKQSYEKPSDKKRRKRKESRERQLAMEAKQRLIASGEWEKRMKKKQEQKKRKQQLKKQESEKNE